MSLRSTLTHDTISESRLSIESTLWLDWCVIFSPKRAFILDPPICCAYIIASDWWIHTCPEISRQTNTIMKGSYRKGNVYRDSPCMQIVVSRLVMSSAWVTMVTIITCVTMVTIITCVTMVTIITCVTMVTTAVWLTVVTNRPLCLTQREAAAVAALTSGQEVEAAVVARTRRRYCPRLPTPTISPTPSPWRWTQTAPRDSRRRARRTCQSTCQVSPLWLSWYSHWHVTVTIVTMCACIAWWNDTCLCCVVTGCPYVEIILEKSYRVHPLKY